jgi:hypothetical protein
LKKGARGGKQPNLKGCGYRTGLISLAFVNDDSSFKTGFTKEAHLPAGRQGGQSDQSEQWSIGVME